MYGKRPPVLPLYSARKSPVESVDAILTSRATIHHTLTRRLQKYQDKMKSMADSHRRDVNFSVGDWVYVCLRPYRQTSL